MDQARTPRDVADRQPLSNDQQASTVRKAVGLQVFLVCVCVCVCVCVFARARVCVCMLTQKCVLVQTHIHTLHTHG